MAGRFVLRSLPGHVLAPFVQKVLHLLHFRVERVMFTPEDAAVIRARWEEEKSVMEGLVLAAEAGLFRRLPPPVLMLGTGLWNLLTDGCLVAD